MSISVIIPAYNEEDYIGKLLEDLTHQTNKPEQVIVADCSSEDGTVVTVLKFTDVLPLEIVNTQIRSAASARNSGASATQSDYLLFIDADMRIRDNFVEKMVSHTEGKGADFVSPRFRAESRHPIDALVVWYINLWIRFYHMFMRRRAMGIGGALLIRKSKHDAIGGFNPEKREFDDIDYCWRLNKEGVTFTFAWEAIAITSSRRFDEQGRLKTIIQGLPDNHLLVRKIVRPSMKRLGVEPKWKDKD